MKRRMRTVVSSLFYSVLVVIVPFPRMLAFLGAEVELRAARVPSPTSYPAGRCPRHDPLFGSEELRGERRHSNISGAVRQPTFRPGRRSLGPTALTFKAVFRLAYRQTEGLIGSVIGLLGLDLAVPDHTTLCRRAATLEVPRPKPRGDGAGGGAGRDPGPMHRLVDSTGLKLIGAGEWLVEKHGAKRRRSWRKMHLGVDARTGRIVAATLTDRDEDDAAQVGPLLDQVADPVASVTADGAYDQESVYADVAERHPDADVVVPPRSTAVPSESAETAPTQRDRHLQLIAEKGRMGWQKATGYNARARAEAAISRYKRVIGD